MKESHKETLKFLLGMALITVSSLVLVYVLEYLKVS
jgi:hypothetical protein